MQDDSHKYDDIIGQKHHVSVRHPRMSIAARAAQFAPFSALTGFDDAVNETARLTEKKAELDENRKAQLDARMKFIQEYLKGAFELDESVSKKVKVTYFEKDDKKEGGCYKEKKGEIKKVDVYAQKLIMKSGTLIPIHDIYDLDGEMFYISEFTFSKENS